MLQMISVQSSNTRHDALFLSNFASLNIVDELKRIDGVSDVVNFGERRYAMRIWLNPDKLAALGVTLNEVTQAIKEQNLQISLGTIGDTALTKQTKYQYTLVAKTRLSSAKELKRLLFVKMKMGQRSIFEISPELSWVQRVISAPHGSMVSQVPSWVYSNFPMQMHFLWHKR